MVSHSRLSTATKPILTPILKSQIKLQDNDLKWTRHTDHIDQADTQTIASKTQRAIFLAKTPTINHTLRQCIMKNK